MGYVYYGNYAEFYEVARVEMLRKLGTGLFVIELMGQGVNYVTGDYSRGASGFWVENGQIAFPVQEITIAGNLKTMLRNLVAIGNDVDLRGNVRVGSILLEQMAIAGEKSPLLATSSRQRRELLHGLLPALRQTS